MDENEYRQKQNANISRQEIIQMFEKKFQYQRRKNETQWNLPPAKNLFGEYYQLDTLQQLRERLNGVKSKLNGYVIEEWRVHTRRKDPSGEIPWRLKNETKAEFVTVAWCKFFECLHRYPLVNTATLNSLHLCEAPGAFIAALNHYLHSTFDPDDINWKWLSTTLNPYYEGNPLSQMIADDRIMLYTLDNWLFHGDFTGNIMRRANIEHMQQQCEKRFNGGVNLITADGSIDCVEMPDFQEEVVAQLHFAEITSALCILASGGNFVVKMFTLFEATSVCKLFLLHCVFEEVHLFKPASSKRGNSEIYVICLNFRKETKHLPEMLEIMKTKVEEGQTGNCLLPLFSKSQLPATFLQQHEICSRFFMNLQIRAIEMNIYAFEAKLRHDMRRNHQIRTLVCQEYFKRYKIHPIPEEYSLLYERKGKIEYGTKTFLYRGSYSEREMMKDTTVEERIFKLRSILNDLEKSVQVRYDILLDNELTIVGELEAQYYKGTPYTALHNSLYVAEQVLQLRQKLSELYLVDPIYQNDAKCRLDEEELLLLPTAHENESIDFFEIQRNFLLNILQIIIKQQPKNVLFENYAFLTHFSASVLRFLSSNVFKKLQIATEPSFVVQLSNPVYNKTTLRQLISLQNALESEKSVLCVVDIVELHRNDFSKAISEFNTLLLLKNCKTLLER